MTTRASIHARERSAIHYRTIAALVATFGTTALCLADSGASARNAAAATGSPSTVGTEEIRYARDLSRGFREVAKRLAPSVVCVNTVDRAPYEGQRALFTPFGTRLPDRNGKGSGVIVSHDGFVLTNFHVIRGADEISLRLMDQRDLSASVVGVDPDTDLAVLKVDATDLVPAQFGDSDAVEPGEWVLALGNPFGLEQTLTAGIISAKGRSGMGLATYENFLQTDAAINPGNSGGALVDLDGRVIGINTAISSPDGANHGIGFAIPSLMAQRVANELVERGHVLRGWLGVGVAPLLQGEELLPGAVLSYVAPDAPAWRAGLRTGDLVLKLDDKDVASPNDFIRIIGDRQPSSEIIVTATRRGQPISATAILGERPSRFGPISAPVNEPPPPRFIQPPATDDRSASPRPPASSAPRGPSPEGGHEPPRARERAKPID